MREARGTSGARRARRSRRDGCAVQLTDFVRAWHDEQRRVGSTGAFVPLHFELGDAFQCDWSEEGLVVGGIYRRVQVAHLKLCASRVLAGGLPDPRPRYASKLFVARRIRPDFSALRASAGSAPAASSFFASTAFSRAAFSPTSGQVPGDGRFSFPRNRYFRRHSFPPAGDTSR